MRHLRIAIVGAGPGGLTLARILQQKGLRPTVYEREQTSSERGQGGCLDLHPHSGQYALQVAGVYDQFKKYARSEGQDLKVVDKHATVHVNIISSPDQYTRPEIDRGDLRKILLESLEKDTVQWNHSLKEISSLGEGKHKLQFDNGKSTETDLVVGADGAWSRVRPLLTDVKPFYTGVSYFDCSYQQVDKNHPNLCELVGRGSFICLADKKAIIAQNNSQNSIRIYFAFRKDIEYISEIEKATQEEVREHLLETFSGFDKKLTDLISQNKNGFVARRIHSLPLGHSWASRAGVTLLGDAAHLMSPFAGEGVNLALRDAAELGLNLTNGDNVDEAIHNYEQLMFQRSTAAAQEADGNLNMFFAENALSKMFDFLINDP
eukprot:TRINITY_DN7670_c0_g1_i1.p1 TRINITY_DN7670_c0_g1~~TRINITY_DN7670_c0_g1_i1.p1  ORF type:complete len:393 (+),score=63.80 TRINITY_DN7670_c0_g1_i1:50-1180(+)